MSEQAEQREILKAKLNQETAKASWQELQPFSPVGRRSMWRQSWI